MTMREKIARAIHATRFSAAAWDEWTRVGAETGDYLLMADAVLSAMRQPTPGMVAAGRMDIFNEMGGSTLMSEYEARECFCAMIDAAKEETE